jgi:hypothetical protein
MENQRHWSLVLREGSIASTKRKSGYRLRCHQDFRGESMYIRVTQVRVLLLIFSIAVIQPFVTAQAQSGQETGHPIETRNSIHGKVKDPLGAIVANATVELLDENSAVVTTAHANPNGVYHISLSKAGRFRLRALADTFDASLPLTFRAGLRLTFGGESWKLN